MSGAHPSGRRHVGLLAKLGAVVLGMFGFGYALVPVYNVFCDITGLNGKTGTAGADDVASYEVDTSRTVTVEFVASRNRSVASWVFEPVKAEMEVHPGQVYTTHFYAENDTGHDVVAQAVPSVAPSQAARHFNKTECFCFTQQTFEAGEGRTMPVSFVIDPRLSGRVEQVTLSYTLFDTQTAMR